MDEKYNKRCNKRYSTTEVKRLESEDYLVIIRYVVNLVSEEKDKGSQDMSIDAIAEVFHKKDKKSLLSKVFGEFNKKADETVLIGGSDYPHKTKVHGTRLEGNKLYVSYSEYGEGPMGSMSAVVSREYILEKK